MILFQAFASIGTSGLIICLACPDELHPGFEDAIRPGLALGGGWGVCDVSTVPMCYTHSDQIVTPIKCVKRVLLFGNGSLEVVFLWRSDDVQVDWL
jgi:hypothetical protein